MDWYLEQNISLLCKKYQLDELEIIWKVESWNVSKSFYDSIKNKVYHRDPHFKYLLCDDQKRKCCMSILSFTTYSELGIR